MPRHYSTSVMVERLIGLLGTKDVSDWEEDFIKSLQRRLADNSLTALTERQVDALDRLHSKHFA
jgi:hypothetical protein